MKKLGLFTVIMGLVIALTLPALAFTIDGAKGEKMYIGGLFLTDTGYWYRSKELVSGVAGSNTLSDNTQFFLNVPFNARVRGSVEIGDVGGYWELGNGGDVHNQKGDLASNTNSGPAIAATTNYANYIETRKLYGWYTFGSFKILAGKNDGAVYTLTPAQLLGNNYFHNNGFGWGSVYDNRNPMLQLTQNISKEVAYQISLLNSLPFSDQSRVSYSPIPLVAAKVMLNLGVVSLYPAGMYQYTTWDNLPNGFDNTMTSWYAVLPVKVKAGAFTGLFQFGYGQNFRTLLSTSYESAFQEYQRVGGSIKNTTGMNGFVDLGYTMGPVTPHIYFGYDNAKNSDKWTVGDDNNTRLMYGASVLCKIAEGFFLFPEFTYYDYGKTPGVASRPDIGKEWLAGLQFQFIF